jgi:pimeloyl-ACP methyl ester carboxylesterase
MRQTLLDQLFPFLQSDYHVYAVDTPRHGKSRPWSGYLDRPRLMNILQETFSQLGLESFSLVGLSMGGGLTIEYASLHPEQLRAMALFEPGGLGDRFDNEFITWLYIKTPGLLRYLSRSYVKKGDAALLKMLESVFVGGSKPTAPERLLPILRAELQGKFEYKENDMDDWQLDMAGPFKVKWNLLDKIPLIKCPTLWLRGADSTLIKQHEIERAVELATKGGTDAELVVIQNAGHLLPLERPEKANVAVKEFFDRVIA